jgi:hypothetical protein
MVRSGSAWKPSPESGCQERDEFTGQMADAALDGCLRAAYVIVGLSTAKAFGLTVLKGAADGARVVANDLRAYLEFPGYLPTSAASFAQVCGGAAESRGRDRVGGRACSRSGRDGGRNSLVRSVGRPRPAGLSTARGVRSPSAISAVGADSSPADGAAGV